MSLLNATDTLSAADVERMDAYTSYAGAWLAPVVFPLSFAMAMQAIVYLNAIVHWIRRRPLLPSLSAPPSIHSDVPVSLLMLSETIFGVCCIAQCYTNFASRSYVGGASACELQGLYAGYYTFSAPALSALVTVAASRVVMYSSSSRALLATVGVGLLIHVLSALIAALPMVGIGSYMFARDYCQHNVESTLFATLFLVWWALCLTAIVFAACTVARAEAVSRAVRRLFGAVAVYFVVAWTPSIVLSLLHFARDAIATSPIQGLYGVQAIFLHVNQLVVPLLFGYRMRAHVNAAVAAPPLGSK